MYYTFRAPFTSLCFEVFFSSSMILSPEYLGSAPCGLRTDRLVDAFVFPEPPILELALKLGLSSNLILDKSIFDAGVCSHVFDL